MSEEAAIDEEAEEGADADDEREDEEDNEGVRQNHTNVVSPHKEVGTLALDH